MTEISEKQTGLLPVGFALIIILMVIVTAIGVFRMQENNRLMEEIVTQNNVKVELVRNMYVAARERSVLLLRMMIMDDPFERDELFLEFNVMATRFGVARMALMEKKLDDFEKSHFEKQSALTRVVAPQQVEVVNLMINDEMDEARTLLFESAIPGQAKVLAGLNEILKYEQQQAKEALNNAKIIAAETIRFMYLLAGSAILISLAIAIFVIKKTRRDQKLLIEAKDTLEERVQERTQQLSDAYDEVKQHEQEVKLDSQRKKLTVLFSDIVGFTSTTDRMEAEDITNILNHYLTEMTSIALEHGGTVDKYIGDAIMLFFGDPVSHGVKEDAIACVKTAIAMQQKLHELHDIWRSEGLHIPITARIGIHTGYCTVGNFGSEERMDYTIIGGAVNLASRLEHEAPAGGILISADTHVLVEDTITCAPSGVINIRGMAYPVETYTVSD